MGFLSDLFGGKKKQLMREAMENGGRVVDVRTPGEFKTGNVDGSINIPLDKLNDATIKKIKNWNAPILVCCASGMRSASAAAMLQNKGVPNVINGGSWYKVHHVLSN